VAGNINTMLGNSDDDDNDKILSLSESNKFIINKINSNIPFLVSRLGTPESWISCAALENKNINVEHIKVLENNAGIYLGGDNEKYQKLVQLYVNNYLNCLKKSDALAYINNISSLSRYQKTICNKLNIQNKIHSRSIEPFYVMEQCGVPWTYHLLGKKVLIINPFAESMQKQRDNGFKLFGDKDLFKEGQEIIFYKCYNTSAGNHIHKHWYETFLTMCKEIKELEFDIALVSCGGYGLPICNYIKDNLKKSAIYVGGGLQLFFGIMGKRWEKNEYWVKHIDKYGTQFIRPSNDEIIKNKESVENGCYW
jgi:hypothetical protein